MQGLKEMSRILSAEIIEAARETALRLDVSPEISPDDFIFWNIHDSKSDKRDAGREYIESGHGTAQFIKTIVEGLPLPRPYSMLDFASGYGRVARHFPKLLPEARITTSDIHAEAILFNQSIGLESVLSTTDPEGFDPGRQFDVIVAISFFTHMPGHTWGRWLRALSKFLTATGMLIFTTHGRTALKPMGVTGVDASGFHFFSHSEQKDLVLSDYGSTVTFFDYVYREAVNSNLRIYAFREAGAGYQDLVVVTAA